MTILEGHFVRVEADATWEPSSGNYTPTTTDWATIDQIVSQMINGDLGGTWAPLTQIVIAGSGLTLTAPLYVVGYGTLTSSRVGAFQCNQNNIPQLGPNHTGRNRVIVSPCNAGRASLPYGAVPFQYGLQSTAQSFVNLDANGNAISVTPNELFIPLRVHNGSKLTSATVSFAVTLAHTPVQTPAFRVVRVDQYGDATPLTSSLAAGLGAGITNFSGYMFATQPTSSSSWYNGGEAQFFTIPCDQNNVVDVTQYTYWLQVLDEQGGTGYPYQLQVTQPVEVASHVHTGTVAAVALINSGGIVELTYSSGSFQNGEVVTISGSGTPADGGWAISGVTGTTMLLDASNYGAGGTPAAVTITAGQTYLSGLTRSLDGTVPSSGQPVLVKDQNNRSANGIWLVQGGAWTRSPVAMAQGTIIPVAQGSANEGTYWQLTNSPGTLFTASGIPGWTPVASILAGQQVIPLDTNGGLIFTCVGAGTTGSTEPVWPSAGGSVVDGTVTWTASVNPASSLAFASGPTTGSSAAYPAAGAFAAQSTLYLNVAVVFSGIASVAFQ